MTKAFNLRINCPRCGTAFPAETDFCGWDKTPSEHNFEVFLNIQDDRAIRRAALKDAHELSSLALDLTTKTGAIADGARRLLEVHAQYKPRTGLNIWNLSQFLSYVEPPRHHIIKLAYLTRGELTTLVDQGGLGKSRLILWLAICQITGRRWAGFESLDTPCRWLLLGDENSSCRLKADLSKMRSDLSAKEIDLVEQHLLLQAVLEPEDADLCVGDLTIQARIGLTIETHGPGVVVIDPLANFAAGHISKPGAMKEAIRTLRVMNRRAAPLAGTLLLHRARTGRVNIAQRVGYDAANFGMGGKSLYAAARCQMNLMPGKSDDDSRLVLSCAKSNNCQRFETRGLLLDPESFHYEIDLNFDPDAWLADVEGKAKEGGMLCTVQDVTLAVRDGCRETGKLVRHFKAAFEVSKRTTNRLLKKATELGAIKQLSRGKYILGGKAANYLNQDT